MSSVRRLQYHQRASYWYGADTYLRVGVFALDFALEFALACSFFSARFSFILMELLAVSVSFRLV